MSKWTKQDLERLSQNGLNVEGFPTITINIKQPTIAKHPESELQQTCVKWFRFAYASFTYRLFAIPNGGKRNAREAKRMQLEGVVAGVADLFLAVPCGKYHGLFIEMKAGKNGQSDFQKEFQQSVQSDYKYELCRSFQEFESVVNSWMKQAMEPITWEQVLNAIGGCPWWVQEKLIENYKIVKK